MVRDDLPRRHSLFVLCGAFSFVAGAQDLLSKETECEARMQGRGPGQTRPGGPQMGEEATDIVIRALKEVRFRERVWHAR